MPPKKGKGKGKDKGKKTVTRKARAGANKTTEPEIRKSLAHPEEGYWDDQGVWQDGGGAESTKGEEGVGEPPNTSTRAGEPSPTQITHPPPSPPPSSPSPPSLPQPTSSRSSRSNQLSPRSLMMSAEVPLLEREPEPLFLSGPFSDDDEFWEEVAQHVPSDLGQRPTAPTGEEEEEDDLESRSTTYLGSRRASASPRSSHTTHLPLSNDAYITPRSDGKHAGTRTRTVLGELPVPPSPMTPPTPPSERAPLRRNQTYSSRVRHTYAGVNQDEPQVSQTVYNSHPFPSPGTRRGPSQAQPPRRHPPIWSRLPNSDEEEHVDDLLTPEPEEITSRKRYCSTQDALDDEYGDQRPESDSELDHGKLSDSIASDGGEEMDGCYDRYSHERQAQPEKGRQRKRARRDREVMFADYYANEGEHDLYGERLFATDSLESRNWSQDLDYGRPLRPLTTLRDEYAYVLPPRRSRGRHLTAPRDFRDVLPVILEEDERHRLKFTQTRREFMYGEHQVLAPPKPIERITVQQLRERYQLHAAKPFPVDSQLIRAGHRAALDARKPAKQRRALAGGRVRGIRLPGDPRIVHPSDVPDESIEPNTQSNATTSTQVPRTPAERFHHSTPGRLLLQPVRGRAAGRANAAPGGVTYPPLPFTSGTPPTRSTTHASRTSGQITANGRQTSSSGHVSRIPDSVRTRDATGRRRQPAPSPSQRSSQSSQHIQVFPPTQYSQPALGFWKGEQGNNEDFEPEERLEADTPEPEDIPADDRVLVTLDNGEDILVSKSEVEEFLLTEALHELAQPMSPLPSPRFEDIDQFGEQDSAPVRPTQSTRRPLGEIDVPASDQFSGMNMTAYLLRIAERGPQAPAQKTSRELKLEERRQRLEAKRREGDTSRPQSMAPSSASSQPRASQRQPANRFSQPQPSPQPSQHCEPRPTQNDQPMALPPYPNWTDSRQLPGPVRLNRSLPESESPEAARAPLRRTKSVGANVGAPFKRPTRLNATPPPEPTLAERLQMSIAQAVPAYAALRPRRPASPPPAPLGARVARTRSNPYPPRGSVGSASQPRTSR